MNSYYNPVRILNGAGAISEIPSLLEKIVPEKGRILLLAWHESVAELETFTELHKNYALHTICCNFSNPTVEQLFALYCETKDFCPEAVIAIGGGSIMDVGKSLCCCYGKEISSSDEMRQMIADKNYGKISAKWIGVPTTSGTGSEVTCWATIWDPTQNVKRSVESCENYAYAAVVDPDLTKGMPVSLAVSSALDAVAHAIEAYWANGTNIVSRVLALGAVRTIMTHIDGLLYGEENAHKYMAQGSMIAGLAFSNTRTTACHSISYPLTMHYNIPHGTAVAMLLAPVMELNIPNMQNLDDLLDALGVSDCKALSDRINSILKLAGIPSALKDWGVEEKDIPMLAAQGMTPGRADNNPVSLTQEMIKDILYSIYR